jgi:pyruvate/2-oxoglutarate dehydrogenase complex dihydrolipoamide acyltransferase (E2) component
MACGVIVPKESEEMETCVITHWYVKKGDSVSAGDPVCGVETGKASFDLEAPEDGTVLDIFFPEGSEAPLLVPVAVIGKEGEDYGELKTRYKHAHTDEKDRTKIPEESHIDIEGYIKEPIELHIEDKRRVKEPKDVRHGKKENVKEPEVAHIIETDLVKGPEGALPERKIFVYKPEAVQPARKSHVKEPEDVYFGEKEHIKEPQELRPEINERPKRPKAFSPLAGKGRVPASPKARMYAKQRNIALETVKGTGPGGAVVMRDLLPTH